MCGRFTLHSNQKKLAEAIALALPEALEPDYNISPGREVLSISQRKNEGARATLMHWGLKTPQNFHVNARLETADTAPRFRENWEFYRCLVPANGFYEWYADGITKQPYYIYPTDRELCFLAGLWYPSARQETPDTCILLTTEAAPSIREVHHRMPVILPPASRDVWLSNQMTKTEAVRFANEVPFAAHTVSRRVNSVQNNDSRLTEATSPSHDEQMQLF
ncbi:MAG TPA: SOS response-associated peptidase [Opitutales bacterium]|nr:SOS response-associated peptidase [Opitutales bacterium]